MHHPPRTIAPTLAAARFPGCSDGPTPAECLGCGSTIEVHQPEVGEPDRLLGVCDWCGRWYLLDCFPEANEFIMVSLPEREAVLGELGG